MKRLLAVVAVILFATSPAFAKHHHHKHHRIHYDYSGERIVAHPAGCPRIAFCGCGVSVKVFGRSIKELWRAAAWYKFDRASPAPGMVAVRNHHVMYIESYDGNGNAVVYDPNSGGHQTRIHTRSLAGYRIVNPTTRTASYMSRTGHHRRNGSETIQVSASNNVYPLTQSDIH